jgi:DMSO reductase family type II enzyme heme b subunit
MRIPTVIRRRPITTGVALVVLATAGVLQFVGVNPAASQSATLTAFEAQADPGTDPASPAWKQAPVLQAPLSLQGATYPTGGGSIPAVSAQALHFKDRLYIRLEWPDDTKDDTTLKVENFSDAAAIEFPAVSAATVPSVCRVRLDRA